MKLDPTLLLLAAGGFLLLSSRGGGGGLLTLPNGQRIASDGTLYNAAGQVIGRSSPLEYARAVAAQGRAQGIPAAQTLQTIKSIAGIGQQLYTTISNLFAAPPSHVPTAEILRDRIIDDPASVESSPTIPTADILRSPEVWGWEPSAPWDVPSSEAWEVEWGPWVEPETRTEAFTYEPGNWNPEVTWDEAYAEW